MNITLFWMLLVYTTTPNMPPLLIDVYRDQTQCEVTKALASKSDAVKTAHCLAFLGSNPEEDE